MQRAAVAALALVTALFGLPGAGPVAAGVPGGDAPAAVRDATTTTGTGDAAGGAGLADPTDRWIVVLRDGSDVDAAEARAHGRGVQPDRTFRHALRGYSARLTPAQLAVVRADPDVAEVVPDGLVTMASQSTPRGVKRVFGPKSRVARIDGVDDRVDADVAIVDTGIDPNHQDLNVVGGHNCSSTNPNAWRDANGHGTHVAGIVGALDNGVGVVGVAPGVRLWAVRILDSAGNGLVSWYVCGLDWIAAQRDPADPTRPLFEAVNMSVARKGADDGNCGYTNSDLIHRAVCRLVGSGVTVVVAAGNNGFGASHMIPASYDEVITVSALADTDGRPGGLGGNACYSWGSYDRDDTFADFSNYGADIDLIAPGKCIVSTLPGNLYGYMSGTSMAAPHVTGAVALYKASRPLATPADVKAALQAAGNLDWKLSTDPDTHHERLLDVSHIVNLGDYLVDATSPTRVVGPAGATLSIPVAVVRAEDVPDEIDLTVGADAPLRASLSTSTLVGLDETSSTLSLVVPPGTPTGTYHASVTATLADRTRTVTVAVNVDTDPPTAATPRLGAVLGTRVEATSFAAAGRWTAATDAKSAIAAYQAQWSVDGGAWGATIRLGASTLATSRTFVIGHTYALRVRAADAAGNWSAWAVADAFGAKVVQDTSSTLAWSGTWRRHLSSYESGGSTRYSSKAGTWVARTFTGRGISFIAPLSSARGKAQVWIDGVLATTVNLYSSTSRHRRVMFTRTWTTSATHTIRVVVVGTAGHPRVDVDAFLIIR